MSLFEQLSRPNLGSQVIMQVIMRLNNFSSQEGMSSMSYSADRQFVQLVEWAKRIPHFPELPIDDQVALLRAGWFTVWFDNLNSNFILLNAFSVFIRLHSLDFRRSIPNLPSFMFRFLWYVFRRVERVAHRGVLASLREREERDCAGVWSPRRTSVCSRRRRRPHLWPRLVWARHQDARDEDRQDRTRLLAGNHPVQLWLDWKFFWTLIFLEFILALCWSIKLLL